MKTFTQVPVILPALTIQPYAVNNPYNGMPAYTVRDSQILVSTLRHYATSRLRRHAEAFWFNKAQGLVADGVPNIWEHIYESRLYDYGIPVWISGDQFARHVDVKKVAEMWREY